MKVLIVDDNANDRMLLRINLQRHGCEAVIEARDGQEGLELAMAHRPDLIISDALMPRMDGFQFLKAIKGDEELKAIPFLFHSSVYTGFKEEELALSLGAQAFIAKPQEPEALWKTVVSILESRAAGRGGSVSREKGGEEEAYLRRYSGVVAAKLEEKVRELEETLARRKLAEEALKSSEMRYRRLFEAAKDGILILYGDTGRIIDANPFMVSLLGYPVEEYLGKGLCETGPFRGVDACDTLFRELQTKDYIRHDDITLTNRDGRMIDVEFVSCLYEIEGDLLVQCNIRDITERKRTEESLRQSELQRCLLQAELTCAAEMQAKLLPDRYPETPNFEFVARCLPARQVGGDFFDWVEVEPGRIALTLGDVMGSGMTAAMLMSTVRAAIHAATLRNSPAEAIRLAGEALRSDLQSSESFVTLFHAHLDTSANTLRFVDCGHGFVFLRRADGSVEELEPRGLPLGILGKEQHEEGVIALSPGDMLVLYSDGLIDARPELELDNRGLAAGMGEEGSAAEAMESLLAMTLGESPPPDDLTLMIVRCTGEPHSARTGVRGGDL